MCVSHQVCLSLTLSQSRSPCDVQQRPLERKILEHRERLMFIYTFIYIRVFPA